MDGVVAAAREWGVPSVVLGDEALLRPLLAHVPSEVLPLIEVVHCADTVAMEDSPSAAVRSRPESSIRRAFELVKRRQACAVVSPGNTGAMMVAGLLVSGTMAGISRPAIATLIPKAGGATPTVLLDSGANIECRAVQLVQFAIMGSCYARSVLSLEAPRVALLSNGSEPSKGTDTLRAAAAMLQEVPSLHYIGYVEGRDLARDAADVVVCDGFVGNIVLKTMEGAVSMVFDSIRSSAEGSMRGALGMWLARPGLRRMFRQKFDPSAYGGAPLLGLNDLAIVCHGASNGRAIANAVRVAQKFAQDGLLTRMQEALLQLETASQLFEDGVWGRLNERLQRTRRSRTRRSAEDSKEGSR